MVKKRSRKKVSPHSSSSPNAQRLNKVLAAAGLGSRRKVEDLIEQGRVEIDGDIVTDLACKVEPDAVKIKVDGQLLKRSRPVYFALNKPSGVLSTNYDPSGRMRVIDLVPDRDRVFSVGRLDQSSEGLMLLTNDGDLAQRLAHPKFHIQKSYFVVVAGQMSEDELNKLRKGVYLAEGMARIDGATIKRVRKGCTELEILLSEGKNREIRRILARAGHKVVLLRRLSIGTLRLGQLPVGAARNLTAAEVKALYTASDPARRTQRKTAKPAVGAKVRVAKPSDSNSDAAQSTGAQSPGAWSPGGKSSGSKASASKAPAIKSTGGPAKRDVRNDYDDDDDDDDLLSLALRHNNFDNDDADGDADDDFVGDFSGTGGRGSVLAFDEESADAPTKKASGRSSRRAAGTAGTGTSGTGTANTGKSAWGNRPKRAPPIRTAKAARAIARQTRDAEQEATREPSGRGAKSRGAKRGAGSRAASGVGGGAGSGARQSSRPTGRGKSATGSSSITKSRSSTAPPRGGKGTTSKKRGKR